MSMTVKKGDTVVVIAGKDKKKTGKVQEVYPESNRVLVEGINIVTKHKKARTQQEKSARIQKNAPIDASNVMVVCPACGKATRVHHKEVDGKKVRVCKCGVSLDKAYVKATKKDAKKAKVEDVKAESAASQTSKKASVTPKTVQNSVKNAEKSVKTTKTAPKTEKVAASEKKTAAAEKTSQKGSVTPQKSKTTVKKDA